jgi:ketosteroid isomerase-like protein
MKNLIIALIFISSAIIAQTFSEVDRANILDALEQQRIAWNKGDLEGYMNGYWNSDSLRFIGKRGVQYGWNSTLENYRKGYPTKEDMGKLSFEVISIEGLGNNSAFMIGKWKLDYPDKPSVGGHFTLLYRKINGKWLVVADHSS